MKKLKYMYMHTIEEKPGRYEGKHGQICFVTGFFIGKLVSSLKQIKKEQRASIKYRKSQGWSTNFDYGHIRVEVNHE